MRKFPMSKLKSLIHDIVETPLYFNSKTQDQGLFVMSFTQFSKICMNQWRIQIEQQIKVLQRIFVENDENNDGVLDL